MPTARIRARNSVSQSSSVASASVPASASPASACVRPSTRSSTPASRRAPSTRGRKAGADVGVHEQRLGRVADAGALGLGVEDDPLRGVEVGARVDVDVAVARGGVDHRHRGDALQRRLQPLAAARDDEVDDALLGGQLGQLLAPSAGHEHDRARGHAGLGRGLRGDRGQHGVGVRRRRRAAQHDRVARLQAQRGGVDGDVRPRLVDDGDDAERDAHLAHVEAVGQALAVDDLADRVGQRRDRAHAVGHRLHARRVEREAVEQRGVEPARAARLHVARVGLEDLRRRAPRARRRSRAARRPWSPVGSAASARDASRAARHSSATDGRGQAIGDGGDRLAAVVAIDRTTPRRSSRGARPRRSPAAAPRAPAPLFRPMTRRSSAAE